MKKGIFITVEGGDGAGKTTQLNFMKEYLKSRGSEVIFTREPGGTPISEKIRTIILDKKNMDMDPMTEALLYAAARAQHVAQVIRPALERGKIVICDRFVDSSIAYQGNARGLGESVSMINAYAIGDCVPDKTFLLKIKPDICEYRVDQDNRDRLESELLEFHEKVYEGYLQLEKKFPKRIIGIDATKDIGTISNFIKKHLDEIIKVDKNAL